MRPRPLFCPPSSRPREDGGRLSPASPKQTAFLEDFLFSFLIMHFLGIPHGEVEAFPSIKKKKKAWHQQDKYVFNLPTETGVRPQGVSLTFTEKKDVAFAEAPLTGPSSPREGMDLFLGAGGGGLPQLHGLLVTRGAGGSPRARPQLLGSRAATAVWWQVQELVAEPSSRQGPCLRLAMEPGRAGVGGMWPCPPPGVTPQL